MDVATEIPATLLRHPAIRAVRLVGSRADGRNHEFSDWDFAVETDDFASVVQDLPHLFASLRPLTEQWDPYASHACYMLMFPGPTKVTLVSRRASPMVSGVESIAGEPAGDRP